jgi:hypothetical protein
MPLSGFSRQPHVLNQAFFDGYTARTDACVGALAPNVILHCVTRLRAGRSERDFGGVSVRRLSVNRPSLPPLLAKLLQPGTLKILRRHGWQKLHRCIEQQEPRFGKARYFGRI